MANISKPTRFAKVIYFIRDFVPSDEDMEAAQKIGPGVVFRNANFVPENPPAGQIETCDFVAGDVPKVYADKFKDVSEMEGDLFSKFDGDGDGKPGGSTKKPGKKTKDTAGEPEAGKAAEPTPGTSTPLATPNTQPVDQNAATQSTPAGGKPSPNPDAAAGWKAN